MARNWNPKYKINLLEVFKRAYADSPRELRNKIRPILSSESLKFLYGQLVVDKIVENTQNGKDRNGKDFAGTYSKEYRESLEFKIWKSGKRKIDLTLTGDMLSDILPEQTRYTLVFGLNEQDNRNKAQGHITGRYGKKGRTAKRDFLGIPKKEEEELLKQAVRATIDTNFNITADLFDNVVEAITSEIIIDAG